MGDIVSISKEVDKQDQDELKDLMVGNLLGGMLDMDKIKDKLPAILSTLSPKAYDLGKKLLEDGKYTYLLYYNKEYGLILHKVDNESPNTNLQFPTPSPQDIIVIQKSQNGLNIVKDGESKTLQEIISTVMSNFAKKLF